MRAAESQNRNINKKERNINKNHMEDCRKIEDPRKKEIEQSTTVQESKY